MKNTVLLFVILFLIACGQSVEDVRPAQQIKLAENVKAVRDQVNAEQDAVTRRQLLESGLDQVKRYILDTLQLQFTDWQVRVLDAGAGSEDISFGMNIDGGEMSEQTRFKSVVLRARATGQNKIKTGDVVLISGVFSSSNGHINVDPYKKTSASKNVLDNPVFRAEITSMIPAKE